MRQIVALAHGYSIHWVGEQLGVAYGGAEAELFTPYFNLAASWWGLVARR